MRGLPETENIRISGRTPHCLRIKHNTNQVLNPSKAELNSNLAKKQNGFGKTTGTEELRNRQEAIKPGLKNIRPWKEGEELWDTNKAWERRRSPTQPVISVRSI